LAYPRGTHCIFAASDYRERQGIVVGMAVADHGRRTLFVNLARCV